MFALSSIAAAVILGSAPSQDAKIVWAPKPGTSVNYNMKVIVEMAMQGQTMTMDISMLSVNKILKVENGEVTMESTVKDMKMLMDGQAFNPPGSDGNEEVPPVTSVTKLNGILVSRKGGDMMSGSMRAEQMNVFIYPASAVKVGDSWFHDFPANKEHNIPVAKAKFTLQGEEMVGKYQCWKIEKVYAETEEAKGFSAMGTLWIDKADGNMVKYDGNFQNVQFAEMMPPSSGTVKLTRAG